MKKKLIADAGSTKVDWALLSEDGHLENVLASEGINALLAEDDAIKNILGKISSETGDARDIAEIYYYGAGCATPQICERMKKLISTFYPDVQVNVDSDLLGAARAIFGAGKGIACILGTGSNSCLYDGSSIVMNIPSLGYILGDEGSGAALGKRLINEAFKGQLPENIKKKFLEKYDFTLPLILENVYRKPAQNRFLASIVPFISENLWNPYIYSLVLEELTSFVKRNVAMYPGAHSLSLGFTGSIAFNFEKILKEAAASQGYSVRSVIKSPIEGLVKYHGSN